MFDVLIDGGRIARVGRDLPVGRRRGRRGPAGLVVVPGLIDMHVHLREPGQEHKETIATGTRPPSPAGSRPSRACRTRRPVNDSAGVTEFILRKAAEANLARVYPIGAVSRGSKGELLADIARAASGRLRRHHR